MNESFNTIPPKTFWGVEMMASVGELLPATGDNQKKANHVKEKEVAKWARARMAADDAQKALIDALSVPSNVSDEEGI
jgi:hypothetical protein